MGGIYRTTISITQDLKKRMDKATGVNWSAVAARAFENELLEINARKVDGDMGNVIERLRTSKRRTDEANRPAMIEAGKEWAMNTAETQDLERLAGIDLDEFFTAGGSSAYSLEERLALCILDEGSDRRDAHDFWEAAYGDGWEKALGSETNLRAFVDGALAVWEEVKDEL